MSVMTKLRRLAVAAISCAVLVSPFETMAQTASGGRPAALDANGQIQSGNAAALYGVVPQRVFDFKLVDLEGDSRTAQAYITSLGTAPNVVNVSTSGNNWFNVVNAMLGHPYRINLNTGVSGNRTDQWIAYAHPLVAASNAGTVVALFGAVVNDIGQAQPSIYAASISGTLMTVTSMGSGSVLPGALLTNNGVATGTTVVSQVSGTTNGVGTYNVSISQTMASGSLTGTGYTDLNGNYVTTSNVAALAEANVLKEIRSVVASGKKYVIALEPGSTTLNAAGVQAANEYNLRLRADLETLPGAYVLNFNPVVHNPTGSTTLFSFRANCLYDGSTHYNTLCAYYEAKIAKPVFASFLPPSADYGPDSLNDVVTTNPRQLINNALFNTTTGGTTNGSGTLSSGAVPGGWLLKMPLQTTSCTSTVAPETWSQSYLLTGQSLGNMWTLACNSTASDTVELRATAPSSSTYTATDILQCGGNVHVVAGSTNAAVYWDTQMNYNYSGGNTSFDAAGLYIGAPSYTGMTLPNDAYDYTLMNEPQSFPAATTSLGYLSPKFVMVLTGTANMTASFFRPFCNRRLPPQ